MDREGSPTRGKYLNAFFTSSNEWLRKSMQLNMQQIYVEQF